MLMLFLLQGPIYPINPTCSSGDFGEWRWDSESRRGLFRCQKIEDVGSEAGTGLLELYQRTFSDISITDKLNPISRYFLKLETGTSIYKNLYTFARWRKCCKWISIHLL
jgi:hypothetical protein